MFSLLSSKFLAMRNTVLYSVYCMIISSCHIDFSVTKFIEMAENNRHAAGMQGTHERCV